MTQIVTTGGKYTDIDGLASVIAFAELQNLIGVDSLAVFRGQTNASVTDSVKSLGYSYVTDLPELANSFSFAIMDISDPAHFPSFVDLSKVQIVYDHHFGYEKFWKKRLGDKSRIEEMGAVATMVFGDIMKYSKLKEVKSDTLLLLYTAMISNSLNLNASVTKENDVDSVKTIREMNIVPENWERDYFNEISNCIFNNPKESIENDTKVVKINGKILHIAQLELWDSLRFVESNLDDLSAVIAQMGEGINFLNSPSISEDKTYFVAVDEYTKSLLKKSLEVSFNGNLGKLDRLILRKEILRELQEVL